MFRGFWIVRFGYVLFRLLKRMFFYFLNGSECFVVFSLGLGG